MALAGCQSAGPKGRPGGPPTDYLRGYVGQQRVLRFQGDQERVVVKKKDRPQLPGACDAAVQVRSAGCDGAKDLLFACEGSWRSRRPSSAVSRYSVKRTDGRFVLWKYTMGWAVDEYVATVL